MPLSIRHLPQKDTINTSHQYDTTPCHYQYVTYRERILSAQVISPCIVQSVNKWKTAALAAASWTALIALIHNYTLLGSVQQRHDSGTRIALYVVLLLGWGIAVACAVRQHITERRQRVSPMLEEAEKEAAVGVVMASAPLASPRVRLLASLSDAVTKPLSPRSKYEVVESEMELPESPVKSQVVVLEPSVAEAELLEASSFSTEANLS